MTRVLLNIACVMTLVALGLMVWSILVPHVWPIMIAMSVAQGFGTLAFATYGYVVFRDVRRRSIIEPAKDRFGIRAELEKEDPVEEKVVEEPAAGAKAADEKPGDAKAADEKPADKTDGVDAPKATEAHAS